MNLHTLQSKLTADRFQTRPRYKRQGSVFIKRLDPNIMRVGVFHKGSKTPLHHPRLCHPLDRPRLRTQYHPRIDRWCEPDWERERVGKNERALEIFSSGENKRKKTRGVCGPDGERSRGSSNGLYTKLGGEWWYRFLKWVQYESIARTNNMKSKHNEWHATLA